MPRDPPMTSATRCTAEGEEFVMMVEPRFDVSLWTELSKTIPILDHAVHNHDVVFLIGHWRKMADSPIPDN
jgi:hypothetical protein